MAAKSGIGFGIGAKISTIIAVLLIASIAVLVWLSTRMYVEDNTALIQQMNADSAAHVANEVRELMERISQELMFVGFLGLDDANRDTTKADIVRDFFSRNPMTLAVLVYERGQSGAPYTLRSRAISPKLEELGDKNGDQAIAAIGEAKDFPLEALFKGDVEIGRISLADGSAATIIGIPFVKSAGEDGRFTHALVGIVLPKRLVRVVGSNDLITSFVVDRRGICVAHSDPSAAEPGTSLVHLAIVQELMKGKFNNREMRYVDPQTKVPKLGAFRLVGFGGLGVVAEVPEAKAFEAAGWVRYRAILVAIAIFCFSLLIGNLFSDTLTRPIYELVQAASRISQGDFKINLKPKSRDEVGYLSRSFNEMAVKLEENDRMKDLFRKFHSKEIADKLLSGEVKLGGERKRATILFSDIRGFTRMSEPMPPEEVVELLNEYLSRMVSVIASHGGVVDKFMGDGIMAMWGVPIERPDDTERAVRAALAMREELSSLNAIREKRGQFPLKIGIGLNCGDVTAGNIGSSEKMEYTVIGDAVNLAARIEASTKVLGTDILVDKSIFEKVGEKFIFDPCDSVQARGKSASLKLYKVKGYYDDEGKAVFVETRWSDYEPEASEKIEKIAA